MNLVGQPERATQNRVITLFRDELSSPRSRRNASNNIVARELVHLLEPTHNARFVALMDRFMPRWQYHHQALNRLPVRQETWSY